MRRRFALNCEKIWLIGWRTGGLKLTVRVRGRIKDLRISAHRMHAWEIYPAGSEGFEKAEVTAGGVDTDELSAKTMESRKVSGLFFIGEVVDVTGQLGGFNFQWAWASGAAAGRAV